MKFLENMSDVCVITKKYFDGLWTHDVYCNIYKIDSISYYIRCLLFIRNAILDRLPLDRKIIGVYLYNKNHKFYIRLVNTTETIIISKFFNFIIYSRNFISYRLRFVSSF
jgi:hypothetical protein